ncbi:MAG TPA: hypothetical protein VEQ58_15485, partial [Polyangiaceae bacterium]|nr:hypothetical protein [Polyangiaceae bacterium]
DTRQQCRGELLGDPLVGTGLGLFSGAWRRRRPPSDAWSEAPASERSVKDVGSELAARRE